MPRFVCTISDVNVVEFVQPTLSEHLYRLYMLNFSCKHSGLNEIGYPMVLYPKNIVMYQHVP